MSYHILVSPSSRGAGRRQTGRFALTGEPAVEPLETLAAKQHCRAEYSGEDALFAQLIVAARRYVEKNTGLALIDQTWTASFDAWEPRGMDLRPHPVASIEAVRVFTGSALVAQDVADFQFIPGRPAQLIPNDSYIPAYPARHKAGIEIDFIAGYGATGADVPADIVQAMKLLVGHWYENREPTALAQNLSVVGDIKFTVSALLNPYQSRRLS